MARLFWLDDDMAYGPPNSHAVGPPMLRQLRGTRGEQDAWSISSFRNVASYCPRLSPRSQLPISMHRHPRTDLAYDDARTRTCRGGRLWAAGNGSGARTRSGRPAGCTFLTNPS